MWRWENDKFPITRTFYARTGILIMNFAIIVLFMTLNLFVRFSMMIRHSLLLTPRAVLIFIFLYEMKQFQISFHFFYSVYTIANQKISLRRVCYLINSKIILSCAKYSKDEMKLLRKRALWEVSDNKQNFFFDI
jgi:hypothetical protein